MVLLNRFSAALLAHKEVIQGRELLVEGWLLEALGEVGPYLSAVEDPLARPHRIIGQTETGHTHRPKKLVLLHPASKRIEKPAVVVALQLPGVVIIGALYILIEPVDDGLPRSALIVVAKGKHAEDVLGERVVALKVELVAIIDLLHGIGIRAGEVQDRLSRYRVPVGAVDHGIVTVI